MMYKRTKKNQSTIMYHAEVNEEYPVTWILYAKSLS